MKKAASVLSCSKILPVFLVALSCLPLTLHAYVKTRLVHTKYGSVQGFIRPLGQHLGDVEVFLGVPYASAPIEEGRFTPTNTPTPWEGAKDATQQPPVCPQLLPDVDDSINDKRSEYIRRIRPFLANQSEDCLTLSVYSPLLVTPGSKVYPVVVYLHGESFSWGAGSLYDGSVLAAYGRVVVVTINYRLGPLGFLNSYPGQGSPGVASNFALLDQIAALSWLADNIRHFHGDNNQVTLVGRDTGAACITYLMESPVMPPGLFHRAVLLSGGSWCPWATVTAPLSNTIKLALTLDCPVPDERASQYPPTVACLRRVPLPTLMAAARTIISPTFTPAWGPSEDGVVVNADIRSKQSRDLMIGYTPWEGWSWLPPELHTGVNNDTFIKLTRTLVRNTRRHHLRAVLAAALQEYTDWSAPTASDITRRDQLLKMLGDALLVAPLHHAADSYSTHRKVFVFMGDFSAQLSNTFQLPGWELGLLWGVGLSEVRMGHTPVPPLPGPVLVQLSEYMITLITNFAKSGNPNYPRESPSPGFAAIDWEAYQPDTRTFFRISVPPTSGSHYRAHQLALWSWLVPELEAVAGSTLSISNKSWEVSDDPALFYGAVRPVDPWAFLDPLNQNKSGAVASGVAAQSTSAPGTGDKTSRLTTTLALSPTLASPSSEGLFPAPGGMIRYSSALLATLGLGVSVLLINAIIFGLVIWRRPNRDNQRRKLTTQHPQLQSVSGGVDQTMFSMMNMAPTSEGVTTTISQTYLGGTDTPPYPHSKKSNLKKKSNTTGMLSDYSSASCDRLSHTPTSRPPSILRNSPSTQQGFYHRALSPDDQHIRRGIDSPHQLTCSPLRDVVRYSCNSPVTTFEAGRTGAVSCGGRASALSYRGHGGSSSTGPQSAGVPGGGNNEHNSGKHINRRQSIPCLVRGECTSQDCSGSSMTLPRQTTPNAKHKQKGEGGLTSREGSSSLFDLSNVDLRASSSNVNSQQMQQQYHHSSHQRLVHHDGGPADHLMRKNGGVGSSCSRLDQGNQQMCQQQQQQQQQQQVQHHNSPQISTPNSPHIHHQHKNQHLSNPPCNQEAPEHQLTPYSVIDSCPPEFQNERSNDLPDPPPPPRVTGQIFHHRQSPACGNPSGTVVTTSQNNQLASITYQQKLTSSTASPPSGLHQHTSTIHQHHRPRQVEKRVTIVEEGVHRL